MRTPDVRSLFERGNIRFICLYRFNSDTCIPIVVLILHMLEKYNINQTTLRILGLYRNDYKNPLHLREISRRTEVDVKSVQLQVRGLEKVNILSSV